MADTYTFESLLNTTDGMTAIINNKKQDDNTVSVTGVDWFTYAGKTVSTVYVNGNNWIGFGKSTEQLKICRRDGTVYYIYRQEGTLNTGKKFLKIRVEGYTYYSSTAAAYAVKYEVFLIEGQTIFVNIIQIPTNSSYIGTSSITDGTNTKSLNITTSTTMPLYVLVGNAGESQEVTYEMYPGKTYTSISVTTMPDKTSYYEGQTLDLAGLVVTGTTSDGETIAIDGYSVSGFDSSTVGTNTLTVSFKNCTTTFDLQILKDVPSEIVTVYTEIDHILLNDEQPKVTGIDVKYASGKTTYTSSGFEVSGFDSSVAGTNTLTITYEGLEKQIDIHVSTSATIALSDGSKTTYLVGDDFLGAYCTVEYDDGYQKTVSTYSDGLIFSGFDSSTVGTCEITMKYRNITGTATITITDTLTSNIGYENPTDITASLNVLTGLLTISGAGETQHIYSPSRGEGGLLNDGGQYSDKVKKLVVEEGITGLNGECFYNMTNMTEATLPNGLLTIGNNCFEYCSSLKEVTIPESVNQIGNFAFYNSTETDLILTILSRNVSIENTNSDNSTLKAKKIRGYVASTAEEYAEKYGVEFEALNKIASVSIKTEPNKKEYWTLETIITSGMILEVTDEDEVSVEVTGGFEVEEPDMGTIGEKNVVVRYKGYTNTYKITVTAPSFEDIFNNTKKMTSDKNTASIPWFMFDGEECNNVLCYTDGTLSFNGTKKIDVMRNKLNNSGDTYYASKSRIYFIETILNNSVRVAKFRSEGSLSGNYRKGYFPFEIYFFSTGDIYIYISGTTQTLTTGWKGTLTSGGKTYSLYGPATTAANKSVSAQTSCYRKDSSGLTWEIKAETYSFQDLPKELKIVTLPNKIDYFVGDSINTDGMAVILVYGDGKEETSKGYSVSSPDMLAIGIKEVTVTDTETGFTSQPFNIYVNLKKNIGNPVETDIVATSDIRNKILSLSGTGETADYDVLSPPFISIYKYIERVEIATGITTLGDAIFAAIYEGISISGLENIKEVGVYAFYSAKITGNLSLPNVEEIKTSAFTAAHFNSISIGNKIRSIGESAFNADALEISIKRFKDSISGSPWGAKNATITWSGVLISIKITPPTKTEYIVGENIDLTGLTVTAVCDTGETEDITDYSVSGYTSGTPGKQIVTVTYKEFTDTFTVNVYGTTENIRIAHYPVKTYYKSGENLDLSGLVVMIIDSRGVERETTNYSVSNLDTSVTGEQTITVSYQETKGDNLDQVWFEDFSVFVTKDATNPFMKENTDIKITVHWPNGEFHDLTNTDIVKKSMKLKESICNERYFIWGGCISNCLTFQTGSHQFWGSEDEHVPRGNIELYIECEGTKVRLFTGTIDSGKRTSGLLVRTIVAYDYLYKFRNVDVARWYKNQTTDKQAILKQKHFRTLLFEYLGIEQEDAELEYDDTYVPNTWTSGEMKPVDILQDLCLQNSVFGWMNRNGKFRYLTVKPNARVSGTSKDGVESYEYYDSSTHYDVVADDSTEITEGRIWYPKEFIPDPYPGLFSPGDISAQDAYEANIYYIRDSFFVGNDDWIEYVFDADEYGALTRVEPLMKICYGTTTKIDNQHLYLAQGYKVKVRGNPLTRIGSKIQLLIKKRTPPLPEYPEGKDITWKINSYIMSRTMEITGRGIMETYSAENGPYNSNKSQLGKHTQEHVAQISRNRSKLPKISYKEFSSGSSGSDFSTQAAEAEIKVADFKCVKKLSYDKYSSMLKSGKIRDDTLYCTWEED